MKAKLTHLLLSCETCGAIVAKTKDAEGSLLLFAVAVGRLSGDEGSGIRSLCMEARSPKPSGRRGGRSRETMILLGSRSKDSGLPPFETGACWGWSCRPAPCPGPFSVGPQSRKEQRMTSRAGIEIEPNGFRHCRRS